MGLMLKENGEIIFKFGEVCLIAIVIFVFARPLAKLNVKTIKASNLYPEWAKGEKGSRGFDRLWKAVCRFNIFLAGLYILYTKLKPGN